MSFWYTEEGAIESVAAADRGFRYGDGLFETIAIRDGQPRLWRLHVERLANGCKRLGIPTPDDAHLASLVRNALARSGIDTERAISRLVVTAGAGTRGYRRPEGIRPGVLVEVTASQALPRRLYRDGVEVRQCRTPLARQPLLAGIKSLNRLEQVLARNEWQDESVFEGLMCDTGDLLICGTMTNVFIARDNSLKTPSLARCGVAGVMRRHVMELLAQAGTPVAETDLGWQELLDADEIFLTNSQIGVIAVTRCGERTWPGGALTRQCMRLAAENGVPECQP